MDNIWVNRWAGTRSTRSAFAPVWSKNSCSFPMVEFQQPAQALTGADLARRFADSVRRSGKQNHIPLSLVIPFTVKMLDVI